MSSVSRQIAAIIIFIAAGCSNVRPLPSAGLRVDTAIPLLPSPPRAAELLPPAPQSAKENVARAPLELEAVLASVERQFPLLLAAELERDIASGQRLATEGAFDLNLRVRGSTQAGTFPNDRFDATVEQATIIGASTFAGYRLGRGDFPVYYGERQTADGGEFRAGVLFPLLRDAPIDRRRALLRQAQIGEALVDPVVQRARIDFIRNASRAYWNWLASGGQVFVAHELLRIARERQAALDARFKAGQIDEFPVIDNRRLVAEREGASIAAERRWQQASFDLSLFVRDASGNPEVPSAERLPPGFSRRQLQKPDLPILPRDIEMAFQLRPELMRFQLLKERATVDLRLAENQALPALNATIATAQDAGPGKRSTGVFALDRSTAEAALTLEVPLQRSEARGREQSSRATLMQLLAQERYARDQIAAEVQDAVSNLDRTFRRLSAAREEQQVAERVAELERQRFLKGQSTLFEVNFREIAAAGAESKVIDTLADYYRAWADYRAALGIDGKPRTNAK